MSRIFTTTLRLNLDDEDDRRAWERLHRLDKQQYRSYSKAIVAALNGYFDRKERLAADPYLETREKEDAFLRQVIDAIEAGLRSAPLSILRQTVTALPVTSPDPEPEQDSEDMAAALDFVDSF